MSSSTKNQLIHEASRMLLAKGLKGFSLQELATSLKIKKASLFHYFPNKNSLAVELYQFYQTSFEEWTKKHEKLSPRLQILRYAKELTRWIVEKKRICPVGALSLEWHLVDPEIRSEIKKLHELQRDWLGKLIKVLSENSSTTKSSKDLTVYCMALIQGSIQIARINNEPELVMRNIKIFLNQFKE